MPYPPGAGRYAVCSIRNASIFIVWALLPAVTVRRARVWAASTLLRLPRTGARWSTYSVTALYAAHRVPAIGAIVGELTQSLTMALACSRRRGDQPAGAGCGVAVHLVGECAHTALSFQQATSVRRYRLALMLLDLIRLESTRWASFGWLSSMLESPLMV